ncbi:hypothetical protein QO002_000538 [Pararhizobium capsulatum DSM 1112]|uniref:SH3b domain-containing protein n=1 Tax=Pararhizobium capsulatum DSM 1112 TaxID=1121113 RepID=A0ABU0BJH1_9HYPH|nr:SH3 domain-containing protein [Pararhizobium capsulatum]MDQ0318400.1 hypothetical protein [Pararhizobium capsulatum DSM 1112]
MRTTAESGKEDAVDHSAGGIASLMLIIGAAEVGASDRICRIADPTGTPLNIRSSPNRALLSTIDNGRDVRVLEEQRVKHELWPRIMADGQERGWVFGSYLDCVTDADAMKSAPTRPPTPLD